MIIEIKNRLKDLGFSNNEIKVYLALTKLGEVKASEVAKKCDFPRTTVISILNNLEKYGYITTHKYRGIIRYWIESPRVIKTILENKIEVADTLSRLLTNLYRKEAHFPTIQFYDTKLGIKNFIEKTLSNLENKSIIYTIDTPNSGNYAKIFSKQKEENLTLLKNKKDIITKTLVPFGSLKKIPIEKIKRQNIEIKELPININFDASLWIVDNSLIHFSGNPPFIIVIKQDKIIYGIKSIYDFLWNMSSK